MSTITQVKTTLNQTMSLLDLNYQINKQSTKATIEFIQSYSNDLSEDIMYRIRTMHNLNVNKAAPEDPMVVFDMFQEIIQDAIDERIELLRLDIPSKKRGRVSKKKPSTRDITAVEDSDDEAPKKKRGRKKKEVIEETTVDAMNNMGLSTSDDEAPKKKRANKKASKPKAVKGFKIFRRIEKMVEKPKGSGKYKKATPWRKIEYTLKEGEQWLDTWSLSEKGNPKAKCVTFDHKPTDEEIATIKPNTEVVAKKPVEKPVEKQNTEPVAKKPVEKPVLKKQQTLIENPEEVNQATQVKDKVKELVEEVDEDEDELVVEDQLEEEEYEDETQLPTTVSNFTPSGEYLPFTALDGEDNLIYYTDKTIKQYGMVIDSLTGDSKGWIADEEADELVDQRPSYDHEEDNEEDDWEVTADAMNDFMM